jgi:type IV pilus assembly protein PilA
MTATTLRPQLRSELLRQIGGPNAKKENLLQKGFTLVELMVVIVIVGILSAVAIPNFLASTDKAKATEAKTQIASILKQGQAYYQEDPTVLTSTMDATALATAFKSPADGATKFNYAAAFNSTSGVFTVTATANSTFGTVPSVATIAGCVKIPTGKVEINTYFSATAPTCA